MKNINSDLRFWLNSKFSAILYSNLDSQPYLELYTKLYLQLRSQVDINK